MEDKLYPINNQGKLILKFFIVEDYNCRYRVLSRLARDVLVIPISSVPSEATFSTSGRVFSDFRCRLLPFTVEALVCSQDWIRDELVKVKYEEEVDTFNYM